MTSKPGKMRSLGKKCSLRGELSFDVIIWNRKQTPHENCLAFEIFRLPYKQNKIVLILLVDFMWLDAIPFGANQICVYTVHFKQSTRM